MKTITITVYEFNELSDKAKEKARDWYRESMSLEYQWAWQQTKEYAEQVGLELENYATDSYNRVIDMNGSFTISALEAMELIFKNHGEACDTFKTALAFEAALDALEELPPETAPDYREKESRLCTSVDAIESDFLTAILKDYSAILQADFNYRESNEGIDEVIIANEYTFTETGKREG